jgi:hypothetical protein
LSERAQRSPEPLRLLAAVALSDQADTRELPREGIRALADLADQVRAMIAERTPGFGEATSPEDAAVLKRLRPIRYALLDLGHQLYPEVPDAHQMRVDMELARRARVRGVGSFGKGGDQ